MVIHEADGRVVSEKVIATPPACAIREQLEAKGMSKEEFSHQMGLTAYETEDLLHGVMEVTLSIAGRLERVLGIPAPFWKNLEVLYRAKLKQIAESGGAE